jgi:pantothenate kinase type III
MTQKRTKAAPPPQTDSSATIERTSIVTYALLHELQATLDDQRTGDAVTLGIVMGLAMFLDERIGPFRAERLMQRAPGIVLETDAHVTETQIRRFDPVLTAFGKHLAGLSRG